MSSFPMWLLPLWLICAPVIGALVSVMIDGTRDRDPDTDRSRDRNDAYALGTARGG